MPETPRRVVVIGGGVAGLAAAHTLLERGVNFLLLEATRHWGGVIRTESEGGFLLEAGPDAILAQKPEGIALCRAIGLGPRLIPTNPEHRSVFILRRGCLHALPEGMVLTIPTRVVPFLTTRLFSWRGKLRMGIEALIPRRQGDDDESIASFMKRRFGAEALELLGEPLLAGIHSGDPERLSIRATFPRLIALEARYGSLTRGILAAHGRRRDHGPSTPFFYSLLGGLGELAEALVKRIPAESRRLGSRVRAVERANDLYAIVTDGGERLLAAAVILAVPGGAGAEILADLAPEPAATLRRIPFVSTAVVFLGYRRADVGHPLDGYGILVPRTEALRMTACTFFSTKYVGRAPDDHVLVRGFFGGARDESVLDLGDRDLGELARSELGRLLEIRGAPVLERVYRWPAGTPQMEVGHLERVAALERRLTALPGLFLTGAGLRSTGIPDGVADAARAAVAAAEYLAGRTKRVCH